jgi:hypothetical protein
LLILLSFLPALVGRLRGRQSSARTVEQPHER